MTEDQSSMSFGTLSGNVLIGDTLGDTSGGGITIGASGLTGQIIIDADNGGGTWDGEVTVGTIVLGPGQTQPNLAPHYERLASELGGGAVGLVPFAIHHESCSPAHNLWTAPTSSSVVVQFYGPVKPEDADDMPIRVFVGPELATNFGDFENVTSLFSATFLSDSKQLQVSLKSGTFNSGRYWLKPITSNPGANETRLLCDDLLAAAGDVPVADGDYWFDVFAVSLSLVDLSGNGIVDTADASIWLDSPVDINGDNIANTVDLGIIVENLGRTE